MKPRTKSVAKKNRIQQDMHIPGVRITFVSTALLLFLCVLLGVGGYFGFLFYQEYKKHEVTGEEITTRPAPPDFKNYNNDYWGIRFSYPGVWWRVTGNVNDAEFYFSSEPIQFLNELSNGEAVVGLKPYNNFQHLTDTEWFRYAEKQYMPYGKVLRSDAVHFQHREARRYIIESPKAQDGLRYIELWTISASPQTKYQFLFLTKDEAGKEAHAQDFMTILGSVVLYPGFGIEK